jgi:hypothetical protein
MQFAVGQDEEQAFAHGLRALALRAIQLAGGEVAELLRHALIPATVKVRG